MCKARSAGFAILLPAKTPADIVQGLNRAIVGALQDAAFAEGLARLNFDPAGSSVAAFAERIRTEHASWGPIVNASGFSIEE